MADLLAPELSLPESPCLRQLQFSVVVNSPNRSSRFYLFVFRADCRKPGSCDGDEVGMRIGFRNSLGTGPAARLAGGCNTIHLLSEMRGVLFDTGARFLRRIGLQTQPFGSGVRPMQRCLVRLNRARLGAGQTNPRPRHCSSQKLPMRGVER